MNKKKIFLMDHNSIDFVILFLFICIIFDEQ